MVVYYKICGRKRDLYRLGLYARRDGVGRPRKVRADSWNTGSRVISATGAEGESGASPSRGIVALVQASLARAFEQRRPVVVLTGREMSDESGAHLPFTGLLYHPREFELRRTREEDRTAAEIWFEARLARAREAVPNPGHLALARLQREAIRARVPFVLATNSVDGLHRRAGSRDVIELKGTLHKRHCPSCGAIGSMVGHRRHFGPCPRCGAETELVALADRKFPVTCPWYAVVIFGQPRRKGGQTFV